MSSLTYGSFPPPFAQRTSLSGLENPSGKNCAEGNDSWVFISDISNMSSLTILRFKELKLIPYWICVQFSLIDSFVEFMFDWCFSLLHHSKFHQNLYLFQCVFLMTRWIIITIIFWKIPKFIILEHLLSKDGGLVLTDVVWWNLSKILKGWEDLDHNFIKLCLIKWSGCWN